MGDFNTNLRALREAKRLEDNEGGLLHDSNNITPIEFVSPDRVMSAGIDFGPTILCLEYMSQFPATPHEVRFAGRHFYLGLDPRFTAPNAQIGVMFTQTTNTSQHIILSPGDIIHIPQGFSNCWCYDASIAKRLSNAPEATIGFVRFVASISRECFIGYMKGEVHPQASAIVYAVLPLPQLGSGAGGGSIIFSPAGLEEIIVYVNGTDGNANRKEWSCGIGLFALERSYIPNTANENPLLYPPLYQSWSLVEIQTACGIGQYSVWTGVADAADGRDCLIFKDFPQAPVLQLARVSAINSFGPNNVSQLWVVVEGKRHTGGHKQERTKVIYDATSAVNTALTTGRIDTAEFENLTVHIYPNNAIAAGLAIGVYGYDESNNSDEATISLLTIASVNPYVINIGPGTSDETGTGSAASAHSSRVVPKKIQVSVPAFGAGNTARVRVIGRTRG